MIHQSLRFFVALVFANLFYQPLQGQEQDETSLAAIITKMNEFYTETDKYSFNWKVDFAQNKLFDSIYSSQSGFILKYNNFFYTEQDSTRLLLTSKRRMLVDHARKTVLVKDFETIQKGILKEMSMGEILGYLDNADSIYKVSKNRNEWEIQFSLKDQLAKSCRMTVNKETFLATQVVIELDGQTGLSFMRYTLSNVDLTPKLNKAKYDFRTYIVNQQVGVKLTSEYASMKLTYLKL